jgi:hypothetical protein
MTRARRCLPFGGSLVFLFLILGCATSGQGERQSSGSPSADPLAPARLQDGPSLHETGRIAVTNVANTGVQIDAPPTDRRVAREQRVEGVADASESAVEKEAGVVDAALLKREIRSRFAELNDCPREIARHNRTAAVSRARRLTLRWTILSSGQVANTAVVATSSVDARVMDCVKRQMSLWSFVPPTGGSVSLERPFAFRR